MPDTTSDDLSVPQLAAYLNLSKTTIYRMVSERRFPTPRVRGSYRFSRKLIDTWIVEQNTEYRKKRILWWKLKNPVLKRYRYILGRLLQVWGHLPLDEITTLVVERYKRDRIEAGQAAKYRQHRAPSDFQRPEHGHALGDAHPHAGAERP